ncbi:MAG TPA: hypothetical protein VGN23_09765 [Verrucomicrobiae bacterium]|jgi:hypothetical protein
MSKIKIGTNEHGFCDVSESWIHQHVHDRQKDGQPVCAIVTLKDELVDVILSTPNCSHGHGGGRCPNEKEQEIFNLWEREHLSQPNWTSDNLIAFVKKAHRLVC